MHDWMKSKAFIAIFNVWCYTLVEFDNKLFSVLHCAVLSMYQRSTVSNVHRHVLYVIVGTSCPTKLNQSKTVQRYLLLLTIFYWLLLKIAYSMQVLRSAISPICIEWWEYKITSVKLLLQYHLVINFHKNK